MGLDRPIETATPVTVAQPGVAPSKYEVTAPECFDNAAHVLQQANSGEDMDYRRVAVAMEWRLLGEAVHNRDLDIKLHANKLG